MSYLTHELQKLSSSVEEYKELAKQFYFEVLFMKHRCPHCGGALQVIEPSWVTCECGCCFDPTVEFQRSKCCGAVVRKNLMHYACSLCGQTVPSRFLFAERLFDREYFREMMERSRERRKASKPLTDGVIRSCSGILELDQGFDLDALEGFQADLDELIGTSTAHEHPELDTEDDEFEMSCYWHHLVDTLSVRDEILFDSIDPLCADDRQDRVWRFVTLIFMEHESLVLLSQYGNSILVERA